jgi:putative transposase
MDSRVLKKHLKPSIPKPMFNDVVIHKVSNTLNKVRKKDQFEVAEDLKLIYRSMTRDTAIHAFHEFKDKWSKKYPREVQSWEQDLDVLLTFMKYPTSIRSVIYTTNAIERTIKEIRKRLKTMNSLTSIEAAEKITFLTVQDFHEKCSTRKLGGFSTAYKALQDMFEERY